MKIKQFNRPACNEVRSALEIKLEKISAQLKKELGITVQLEQGGKYSDTTFTVKLVASINGVNPLIDEFNKYCTHFGLEKTDLGKSFTTPTGTYTIMGLKTRSRKYPIICKEEKTGKSIRVTQSYCKNYLNK